MKKVSFVFHNIQSHAHTEFSLQPGLNFILADDNNVGKSTIFKVLSYITRMPNIRYEDSRELLRYGESKAYVAFVVENEQYILWLFKEDETHIRSFFEIYDADGSQLRSIKCPSNLLDALDIIRADDGSPVNFNDADSVQLVVQDTSKNDEVLSRVLVDLRVEAVKANSKQLNSRMVQDYRIISAKEEESRRILESMTYIDSVDEFNKEQPVLEVASRILDAVDATSCTYDYASNAEIDLLNNVELYNDLLSALSINSSVDYNTLSSFRILKQDLEDLSCTFNLLDDLSDVDFSCFDSWNRVHYDELIDTVLSLLDSLSVVDFDCFVSKHGLSSYKLTNIASAIEVLNHLVVANISAKVLNDNRYSITQLVIDQQKIYQQLSKECSVVSCPVKGKVFYSDEKCIPCGN